MANLKITLELANTLELEALESALDMFEAYASEKDATRSKREQLVCFPEERPKAPLHRLVPRAPKPAIMDEEVMRGLNLLAHYAPREVGAYPESMPPIDHEAIRAARRWLEEANS